MEAKIFQEMQGIFSWLEMQQNNKNNMNQQLTKQVFSKEEKQNINKERTYYQLQEFFNFLKLDVNHEEIEALNELVNPDASTDKITYEKFFDLFVKSQQEKEKENKMLKEAFKNLTIDKNNKSISIQRLKDVTSLYDKKYKNSMEKIINDFEISYAQNGQFNFEDYVNDQFPINK